MTPEEKLKTLNDSIRIYTEEFNKIFKELTQIRTDKSTEAKKKLEDYQKELPTIELKVEVLRQSQAKLETDIAAKKASLDIMGKGLHERFNQLETSLKNSYDNKVNALKSVENSLIRDRKSFDERVKQITDNLKAREDILLRNSDELQKIGQSIDRRSKIVEEQEKALAHREAVARDNINLSYEKLNKQLEDGRLKKDELDKRENELKAREDKANEVIDKLNTLKDREDKLKEFEESLNIKRDNLNKERVEMLAGIRKNSKRTDELFEMELALKKREENLKILEAKIGG